jgi:inner membrane protein COX18
MLSLRLPPSILRSPSTYRLSTQYSFLRPQRLRQFHASPSRHGISDMIVGIPHEFMVALHSTGLSWAAVIPITAITIRCIIVPFLIVPARREREKMTELAPMVSANALLIRENVERQVKENPQIINTSSPQNLYKRNLKEFHKTMMKSYNVHRWTPFRTLLQIPVFVVVVEALRRMMGMERGLLFFKKEEAPKNVDSSTLSPEADVTATLQMDSGVPGPAAWYEPSMTIEGPFSIVDLTTPDPTLCLPFVVSALMIANLSYGNRRKQNLATSNFGRRVQNALLGFAFLLPMVTLNLPAGFLYYWACTSASSLTADVLLDRLFPPRPTVQACKRPLLSLGSEDHIKQREPF